MCYRKVFGGGVEDGNKLVLLKMVLLWNKYLRGNYNFDYNG